MTFKITNMTKKKVTIDEKKENNGGKSISIA